MRLLPKNKSRILIAATLPILLSFIIHSPRWWFVEIRSHTAFLFHSRVTDKIGSLGFWHEWWFERYLQQIADESGVDIRFLLVPKVEGESLEQYSVAKARALGIGRDAGRRGLLFVFDSSGQRLRLEVGAQLEGIVTDAFAGYLMRNHVRSFFGAGNPRLGVYTTLMLVHHRLRAGVLGQEFDPRTVEVIKDARRLALGGGASAVTRSDGKSPFLNSLRPSNRATKLHFAPQPTPAAAYLLYLEWIATGGYATDVPLFTSLSQGTLGSLTMTRGFNDFLLFYEYNQPYRIEVRDSLALLYFTSNPLVGPHFLRRTPAGWVLDIYAEILNTQNLAGEPYAWGLVESDDDFSVTFADRFIEIGSILRLADGDNRPLPVRSPHGIRSAAAQPTGALTEQLTVTQLGQRISAHPDGDPLMLILYYSVGRNSRAVFPRLVEIAGGCAQAGGDVLAVSIDDLPRDVWRLPGFLQRHSADFPPVHLYPWPSGHLAGALDPLGFSIGSMFGVPLVAVRRDRGLVIQANGAEQVAAVAEELVRACKGSRAVTSQITRTR
jgi:TLP18.3/Psb32/MOLO-1 phosphatase superfamily protein